MCVLYNIILWENEATGSRKVFKYLPGLRDSIKKTKCNPKVSQTQNTIFYRIFLYILFGVDAGIILFCWTSAANFDLKMVSQRPGRYLKTFLDPVASFSQSMSPYRSTTTPFIQKLPNSSKVILADYGPDDEIRVAKKK